MKIYLNSMKFSQVKREFLCIPYSIKEEETRESGESQKGGKYAKFVTSKQSREWWFENFSLNKLIQRDKTSLAFS